MLRIAHRGACGQAPENTLGAFRDAVAMGMDGVELDVHCAATGEVVVMHDETVNRTTNGEGSVSRQDWNTLKALHIGQTERIPLLEEALEALGPEKFCFIEVKQDAAAVPSAKVIERYVAKGWDRKRLFLISFRHSALRHALQATPHLSIGASVERWDRHTVANAAALGAMAIVPHYKGCTPARIAQAHAAGLRVIPWTVNSLRSMKRLYKAGVDAIISDYPQRLLQSDSWQ